MSRRFMAWVAVIYLACVLATVILLAVTGTWQPLLGLTLPIAILFAIDFIGRL